MKKGYLFLCVFLTLYLYPISPSGIITRPGFTTANTIIATPVCTDTDELIADVSSFRLRGVG